MPSLVKRNTKDIVYEVVDANLAGSKLCIPSTTATVSKLQGIKVATDAAVNCLGATAAMAITEANRAAAEYTTDPEGFAQTNLNVAPATTTVYNDFFGALEYTAVAVAYGARLACAANGLVRAWVTGDGAAAIVGWCAQPGGVSSAGGFNLARISV